jgi:DNA-binding NtrC family response regulator
MGRPPPPSYLGGSLRGRSPAPCRPGVLASWDLRPIRAASAGSGANRARVFLTSGPLLPSLSILVVSFQNNEAAAHEVLIVDGDVTVLRGLQRLLSDAGLSVTAVTDHDRACDQIANRFIAVALVDLDTPQALGGLDLLRFAREKSPLTAVIFMCARKSFEAVANAFRAGAADVIPKTQDSVPYLRERVVAAAKDIRTAARREQVLTEVSEVHEEFLRRLMDLSRQVTDLEDKLLNREEVTTSVPLFFNVLIVDDEPALPMLIERELASDNCWRMRVVQMGGEALDSATQTVPHILVVKQTLPDLPGTMVVKTVKAVAPDLVALVFTPPSDEGHGEIKLVESSRLITLVPSFSDPQQLAAALREVRDALWAKARERRYLSIFRKQHFEFLKRYNLVKQRLNQKA